VSDEFDIIRRYFANMVGVDRPQVVLGPGDDCAILDVGAEQELCVSTDTLISGVHFPADASPKVVAHRMLAANLSDLAAMGATPHSFLLALTLPTADDNWLQLFSTSLRQLTETHAIPLVGGNLSRGQLSATVTVLGVTARGSALRRSGASDGDDVYVSGTVGDAAAGLRLLQRHESDHSLVERYNFPEPRLTLGQALIDVASAAVDISDGLAADLEHLCEASQTGANIELAQLPLSADLIRGFSEDEAQQLALCGGDDYELCFTAPVSKRAAVSHISEQIQVPTTVIGTIETGPGIAFHDRQGMRVDVDSPGYRHF
jgi:thiamine-monophosphate kinase